MISATEVFCSRLSLRPSRSIYPEHNTLPLTIHSYSRHGQLIEMSTSVRQRTTSTQSPAPFPPPSSSGPLPVPSSILPSTPLNQPNGSLPNTPLAISFISAVLASLVVVPLTYVVQPYLVSLGSAGWGWARPQLGAYLASVGVFHLLEFWVTAGWNPAKLSVDCEFPTASFLRPRERERT